MSSAGKRNRLIVQIATVVTARFGILSSAVTVIGRRRRRAVRSHIYKDNVLAYLDNARKRDEQILLFIEKSAFFDRRDYAERGFALYGYDHIHDMTEPRTVGGVYHLAFSQFAKRNFIVHKSYICARK